MEGIKFLSIYHLRKLKIFNGETVTAYDMDVFANKKINNELIYRYGMNLINRPRKLKYAFVTDFCKINKTNSNERLAEQFLINSISLSDSNFCLKVKK